MAPADSTPATRSTTTDEVIALLAKYTSESNLYKMLAELTRVQNHPAVSQAEQELAYRLTTAAERNTVLA